LNDTAVDEYAKADDDSKAISKPKDGKQEMGILRKRHYIWREQGK